MVEYWWIILAAILLAAFVVWTCYPIRASLHRARLIEARRDFHRQRERLEAKFVQLGMVGNRPDAPHWADCEFDDEVSYARNRATGELSAFVGVTIAMDEPAEHPMTGSEAVGHLRAATAVFRFDHDHWETDGRAIFNLSPAEAIRFYHRDLELVAEERPARE